MSEWKTRRFWKEVTIAEDDDGFAIGLDGRAVKTPAKAPLIVPTRKLAEAVAAEWDIQDGDIDPSKMPFTRSSNAAIDKVAHQHAEVADMLAGYGDSDLLCYRADGPESLIARQSQKWDPVLEWAANSLDARLVSVAGVIHAPQSSEALIALQERVHALDDWALTAFHDLVCLSGSLILGFAAIHDLMPPADLWRLSRLDENWQEEQWGHDEEAAEMAAAKEKEFRHAKFFYDISRRTC